MRKKIKKGVIFLFLLVVGALGYQFYKAFQKKEIQSEKIVNLPELSLYDAKGNLITEKDIDNGKWTVFVFFNSECHFCQEEAQQLNSVKGLIKEINFLWVSSEDLKAISDFQEQYQLTDSPNITFLQDADASLTNRCHITATPQFLVYNPEGKLIKNHKGAWRIDNLLKNIDNEFKVP
ncbi:MAG: redoxin domain-containing protein [Maribacter sp.]|nr:redoxin domain-containing protein [Maribacter sp.]